MATKSLFSETQLALLLENKHEYTEHICDLLSDVLVTVFQGLYQKGEKIRSKGILEVFQDSCKDVFSWNAERVSQLYQKIKDPYFSKLLKATFMSFVKSILAQHGLKLDGKLHIRVPGAEHFVHKCAIEMARSLWKRPYLYYHKIRSLERQRNLHECDLIARKAIRVVLRQSIPMEQIFKEIDALDKSSEDSYSSSDTEIEAKPATILAPEIESESSSEPVPESNAEPESSSESEQSESSSESEQEEPVLELELELEPVLEPESEPESESESESEPVKESKSESESEKEPESDSESESNSESESELKSSYNEELESTIKTEPISLKEIQYFETNEDTYASGDIKVHKNEKMESSEKLINEEIASQNTHLLGTKHLFNPKRMKFVRSNRKDTFF